uniref:Uncharacterized protein n=1 Tax=Romanomermis culicivorax TaxID=13658 RepID=A0A915JKA4_ROMCU
MFDGVVVVLLYKLPDLASCINFLALSCKDLRRFSSSSLFNDESGRFSYCSKSFKARLVADVAVNRITGDLSLADHRSIFTFFGDQIFVATIERHCLLALDDGDVNKSLNNETSLWSPRFCCSADEVCCCCRKSSIVDDSLAVATAEFCTDI